MSSGKVKSRRHSLPSLSSSSQTAAETQESDVQEQQVVMASSPPAAAAAATNSSSAAATRKRALSQAEVSSAAKRPATVEVVEGLYEPVSKEQLQVSEHTLCCLPGGE